MKLKRWGHPKPKLVLWLDEEKSSSRGEALLVWHLKRLSLIDKEVAVDYACNATQIDFIRKELYHCIIGKESAKKLKFNFLKDKYRKVKDNRLVWLCHGFEYALVKPAENHPINRLLYIVSARAKLEPIVDLTVPQYQHFKAIR